MKRTLLTLLVLVTTYPLFAQCPDAKVCEKLLQDGLYGFTNMTNTGSFSQDIRTYYLSEQFKKDMRNGKWGGSLTIPIKGVPFTLGAKDSDEKFTEFRKLLIQETELSINSGYYQTVFNSIPNSNLYDAFNQCLQTVCNNNGFGFLPVKEAVTEDYVVFTIFYRPQVATDAMPKVQYFKIENASSVGNSPEVGKELSASTIITAKRDPEKDMILTLQTDRGVVSRKVDAENALSTNKELPIGTIITSYLSFDQFNYASKNNIKSPGELWTAHKSKWAPCDGRGVGGSGFEKVTSKTHVPDLRGMFLRGLNTFDPVNGPAPRNTLERDPDTRVVGDLQQDAFQGHKHINTERIGVFYGKQAPNTPRQRHTVTGAPASNSAGSVDGGYGKPRISTETRPRNVAVYYYIKIN